MYKITGKKVLLGTTALVAALSLSGVVAGQDAVPVSSDQFGYGGKAVAEANLHLDLFGGADENGSIFGGAPSLTIPMGDSLGLQVDGIAGVAADEVGFAGGAAQLFYRDPQTFLVGVSGGGYFVEGYAQYAVAGVVEAYLDNVTLEGLAGYQTGDIMDSWYGRAGIAFYPNPNLRLGAGVSYSDENELGGDVQAEALLTDVPGMALFATGVFDQQGAMGYGGVRFYFNSATNLLSTDRTKQAGEATLIGIHRSLSRPNFFMSAASGYGIRQISLAAGAITGGDGFGDIIGGPSDPRNPENPNNPDNPNNPNNPNPGLIDVVQGVLDNLTDNTALQPLTDLLDALLNPNDGALSALTGALNDLTQVEGGALGPLTDLVNGLVNTQDQALEPLISSLNDLLAGLTGGVPTDDLAGGLLGGIGGGGDGGLGGLLDGLFGGLTGTSQSQGLIDVVGDVVGNLGDGTPLQGVTDLVASLVDAQTGTLSPLTGPLNDLTSTAGGPLAPVTDLVDGLLDTQGQALEPVISGLNGALGGQ